MVAAPLNFTFKYCIGFIDKRHGWNCNDNAIRDLVAHRTMDFMQTDGTLRPPLATGSLPARFESLLINAILHLLQI